MSISYNITVIIHLVILKSYNNNFLKKVFIDNINLDGYAQLAMLNIITNITNDNNQICDKLLQKFNTTMGINNNKTNISNLLDTFAKGIRDVELNLDDLIMKIHYTFINKKEKHIKHYIFYK